MIADPAKSQVRKVDVDILETMLRSGYTQADAARHFGVAPTSITRYVQHLRAEGKLPDQDTHTREGIILQTPDEAISECESIAVRQGRDTLRWLEIEHKPKTLKERQAGLVVVNLALDVIRKASPNHQASAKNNRPMANIVQQVHGDVVNVTPSVDNPHKATVVKDK